MELHHLQAHRLDGKKRAAEEVKADLVNLELLDDVKLQLRETAQRTLLGIGPLLANPLGRTIELSAFATMEFEGLNDWTRELYLSWTQEFTEHWEAELAAEWPDNWPPYRGPQHMISMLDFATGSDCPVVWVPTGDVVTRLMEVPPEARSRVFMESRRQILGSCRKVADGLSGELAKPLANSLRDLVVSMESGHDVAAQALAAALLTTAIEGPLRVSLGKARDKFEKLPSAQKAPLWMTRFVLIAERLRKALATFYPNRGDSIPEDFNRHASVHRVSDRQYTPRNALVATLLVSSLLREFDELEHAGHRSRLGI